MARREGAGHRGTQHVKSGRQAKQARQLRAMERLEKAKKLADVSKALNLWDVDVDVSKA